MSAHIQANNPDYTTCEKLMEASVDITGIAIGDVQFDKRHGVLWVNVNGVCVLRICQIKPGQLALRES